MMTILTGLCGGAPALHADDITLKDGRKITGTVVKKTGESLVVELSPGNMVLIGQPEVKVHYQNGKGEAAYLEALKGASDTIESHLLMAGIAHRSQMLDHERAHYERVLDFDPEHALARDALGFKKNDDGRWILRDDEMRLGRGKQSIGGGRYRFPEILAMQAAEEKFTTERAQLSNEIRRALSNLSHPRNGAKAQATLSELNGPVASAAIAYTLYPRPNSMNKNAASAAHKALFIPILERLGDPNAVRTLIRMCVESNSASDQAVRTEALAALKRLAPEAAFHGFMEALASKDNRTMNLAGELLQELQDERAVLPLIERLITFERKEIGGSQATNAGMTNGDVGFTKGTQKIVQNIPIENRSILGALTTITNQNFGYDKAAWLNWYEQTYVAHSGDLRRDP